MTLEEWGKHKYPDIKNPKLLEVLSQIEQFNPELPAMVNKPEKQWTWHEYKVKNARIARQRRLRGLS